MFGRKQRRYVINQSTGTGLQSVWRLSVALCVSVACNIALAGVWVYHFYGPGVSQTFSSSKLTGAEEDIAIAEDRTNSEVLRAMTHMLPEQLVGVLQQPQLVEEGYRQRDLALGCLVTLHHFDLERALGQTSLPVPRKLLVDGDKSPPILVYPGLSDSHFGVIHDFIARERWPLTPRGLLLALQQHEFQEDPTLRDSFVLTSEFLAIQRLFEDSTSRGLILQMLVDGDWNTIHHYASQNHLSSGGVEGTRRKLLMDYIQMGSRSAAVLLVQLEPHFALKRLDDASLLHILRLLQDTDVDISPFAVQLAQSPRSEAVLSLARTLSGSVEVLQPAHPTASLPATKQPYIVQKGDSLWKISKKTGASIAKLREHNRLTSDRLLPGDMLQIP